MQIRLLRNCFIKDEIVDAGQVLTIDDEAGKGFVERGSAEEVVGGEAPAAPAQHAAPAEVPPQPAQPPVPPQPTIDEIRNDPAIS